MASPEAVILKVRKDHVGNLDNEDKVEKIDADEIVAQIPNLG